MRNTIMSLICCLTFFLILVSGSSVSGQEPGWYPYTIARGNDRAVIRQTPMHLRPYRPMHFYGNSQRRIYYRGSAFPSMSDMRQTTRNLILPRRILTR